MSRASPRRPGSRGWRAAAVRLHAGDDAGASERPTAATAGLTHPHALVTIVYDAGRGRGRIQQTPFVLMKLPTMVHAR